MKMCIACGMPMKTQKDFAMEDYSMDNKNVSNMVTKSLPVALDAFDEVLVWLN